MRSISRRLAQLVDVLRRIDPQRHDRAEAEIGGAVQVVQDVFPRVVLAEERQPFLIANMSVRADEGRHDGLACEIHAHRARRSGNFALRADPRDAIALDQHGTAFDRRRPVAREDARAFVEHRGWLAALGVRRRRRFSRYLRTAGHREERSNKRCGSDAEG
jgi:hypothetical protein